MLFPPEVIFSVIFVNGIDAISCYRLTFCVRNINQDMALMLADETWLALVGLTTKTVVLAAGRDPNACNGIVTLAIDRIAQHTA